MVGASWQIRSVNAPGGDRAIEGKPKVGRRTPGYQESGDAYGRRTPYQEAVWSSYRHGVMPQHNRTRWAKSLMDKFCNIVSLTLMLRRLFLCIPAPATVKFWVYCWLWFRAMVDKNSIWFDRSRYLEVVVIAMGLFGSSAVRAGRLTHVTSHCSITIALQSKLMLLHLDVPSP